METTDNVRFMRRALELARRGWGRVHPNPMVGAVLVKDGTVIGEGWHDRYGGPHAEAAVLREAGAAAHGATLYVTLEPCAHQGKTPPCTDTIIQAGIGEVVYAASDPNPDARGGAAKLRGAGINVIGGIERSAARALNAAFFHVHERGAPFIALKLAMSIDAGIARAPGERTTITGPPARAAMHELRSGFDAVLVGIGTVLTDDPLLTVRDVRAWKPPIRIVVDSNARLPLESQLVQTVGDVPVWLLCSENAPADRTNALEGVGVRVLRARTDGARVDLRDATDLLAAEGVSTVFAEGGAELAASLLQLDLVHRLYIFLAPLFLGPGAVPAFGLARPERQEWQSTSTQWLGSDVLVTMDLPETTG